MSFEIELALDGLEARIAASMREHAYACWERHRSGRAGAPPWPGELAQRDLLTRLAQWRDRSDDAVVSRRAGALWKLCVAAVVASEHFDASTDALPGLVKHRNRVARAIGFADFYQLTLAVNELDDRDVARALTPDAGEVEDANEVEGVDGGDEHVAAESLDPADAAQVIAHACALVKGWGYSLDGIRIDRCASVATARDHLWARTYFVDPGRDIRVLVAFPGRPVSARVALGVAVHELGHAVYAMNHDPALPWSLRDAPTRAMHEAVAELFAAQVVDTGRGGPARQARRLAWRRAYAAFERALYRDPDGDPDRRWAASLAEHLAGFSADADRTWRALPGLVSDPGTHIAYLIAERVRRTLQRVYPEPTRARMRWLLWQGARMSWRELLETAVTSGHDA